MLSFVSFEGLQDRKDILVFLFLQDMLSSFIQHFHLIDNEIWKSCNKYEWMAYLHNLCLLHCTLLQRHRRGGVQSPAPFNYDVSKFFVSCFQINWNYL